MTLARGGPSSEAPAQAAVEYLLVRVGSQEFAVPCSLVRHLCPHPILLPVPAAEEWFAGMLPLGGEAAAAVDLRVLFSLAATGPPLCAVVFEPEPPIPGLPLLGILADKVVDKVRVRPSDVVPPRHMSRPFRRFVRGTWHGRSRPVYLMDLDALAASLPFPALQDEPNPAHGL
ncbi:MAG: chemotaxis protein CheW [Bryobacterales bacterium]|nr:chemotaxis protein CheW [Bryobacterales bacterium]